MRGVRGKGRTLSLLPRGLMQITLEGHYPSVSVDRKEVTHPSGNWQATDEACLPLLPRTLKNRASSVWRKTPS